MRKWIRNKLYPHESEQDTTTPSSHQKQTKNRDKEIKKQKLQQYCAQQCQQEYHELYSLKAVLQNRTGTTSSQKEAFLKSQSQGSPVQQKTHQILVCIYLQIIIACIYFNFLLIISPDLKVHISYWHNFISVLVCKLVSSIT